MVFFSEEESLNKTDKKSVNKVLKYLEKAEKNKNVTSFKKSVDNKI